MQRPLLPKLQKQLIKIADMSNKEKNVVLIGFMGVGKSSIGSLLADRINYKFIDTDVEVEKNCLMPVENIFTKFGEEYFRVLESKVIKKVSSLRKVVISTGGGAVLRKENVDTLRADGLIIHLDASPDTILRNISIKNNRPLLKDVSKEKIMELMQKRKRYYECYDYTLCTNGLSINQVVDQITNILKEQGAI